jgi:hypothetical protein
MIETKFSGKGVCVSPLHYYLLRPAAPRTGHTFEVKLGVRAAGFNFNLHTVPPATPAANRVNL